MKDQTESKPVTTLAGHLYEAYCREVGGKAFNGDPLPSWEEFAGDTSAARALQAADSAERS